jgi:hypothetical protein
MSLLAVAHEDSSIEDYSLRAHLDQPYTIAEILSQARHGRDPSEVELRVEPTTPCMHRIGARSAPLRIHHGLDETNHLQNVLRQTRSVKDEPNTRSKRSNGARSAGRSLHRIGVD